MKKKVFIKKSILFLIAVSLLTITSCSKKPDEVPAPIVVIPPVVTPSLTSLSPSSAVAETIISIVGENFGTNPSNVKVTFGTKIATLVSLSDKLIKVKKPSGDGTSKEDVVVTVGAKVSNKLEFSTLHAISSMTANSFYNANIVITGSDFSPNIADNIVKFGTIAATVVSATSTSLTVKAPDLGAATSASVTVTRFGTTSNAKNIDIDLDQNKVAAYNWTTSTVKTGVIYKTAEFSLFGSARRIYVLDIALNASNTLGIGFSTTNATTTAMCASYGAVGGINAGYFPIGTATDKDGYVRINGLTAQSGHLDVSPLFTNSALIINKNVASIRKFSDPGKNLNLIAAAIPVADAENIIVCGPMLMVNNKYEDLDLTQGHNTSITSRTGLGVTDNGKRVLMVVVDSGNNGVTNVSGVSTPQLTKILEALGATDAMNFDGGGSSVMFVKDQGDAGRVNYPYGGTYQRLLRSVIYVK